MDEKNKFSLIIVVLCLFLMFNIILVTKNNNSDFDNYAYEEGCMNMLAIEYNFSYPIENVTLEKKMKHKYMECAKLRWS